MMPQPNNMVTGLSDSARSSSPSSKKRSRNDEDDINLSPETLAHMSRSERKRRREKKRRSDVNKGFDDLMELLVEIDPVVKAEASDRTRRGDVSDEHLLSRVEIINRTVEVLGRVHQENEERKSIIQQLLQKSISAAPASIGFLNKQQHVALPLQRNLSRSGQHIPGFAGHDPTTIVSTTGAPLVRQRLSTVTFGSYLPNNTQMYLNTRLSSTPSTSHTNNNLRLAVDDAIRKYIELKQTSNSQQHLS